MGPGVITSEHVHALARHADRLEVEEMSAAIEELGPWWGQLSPMAVAHFVQRVIRACCTHPPIQSPTRPVRTMAGRSRSP